MQALFHHFSAEEPGKQPHAAKKDAQAEIVELEYAGQGPGVLAKIGAGVKPSMYGNDAHRREGQQIDPYAAPHPEALAQLYAEDGHQLRHPQLPGGVAEESPRCRNPAHTVPPPPPIRY